MPFLVQLLAVVVAPTDPGLQLFTMLPEPVLEAGPYLAKRRGRIDVGLADVGQLATERGQLRAPPRAHETLEVVDLTAFAGDQARADFNDFHLRDRPPTLIGGGLQVDHQPMAHTRLPCRSC